MLQSIRSLVLLHTKIPQQRCLLNQQTLLRQPASIIICNNAANESRRTIHTTPAACIYNPCQKCYKRYCAGYTICRKVRCPMRDNDPILSNGKYIDVKICISLVSHETLRKV